MSCDSSESEEPVTNYRPAGSKEISLIIDSEYNFKEYKAHTIIDSANLNNPNDKLISRSQNEGLKS